MSRTTNARRLACKVGAICRERRAFAGDILDAELERSDIGSQDAAFARVLALGVAATSGTLDEVLDRCMHAPTDVEANVRDALRVSTYEIIFLHKDAYVAVDQGVGLVRSIEPRASRLANAVLRKVVSAVRIFPFGDPATDDAALARLYGFPAWLAKLLITQMGRQNAAGFMDASNHAPSVYVGVNEIRSSVDTIRRAFANQGFELHEVATSKLGAPGTPDGIIAGCLNADDAQAVTGSLARSQFLAGTLLVSDAAAQYIAGLALPQNQPYDFLEIGCGRGTKSILLQSGAHRRWDEQMQLVPVDNHRYKTEILQKRMHIYGCDIERILTTNACDLSAFKDRTFDAALVDAPCSGIGTLRRHPEIRWNLHLAQIKDLADLQLELLCEAARHVSQGGKLTYSTCSPLEIENESVVKKFLGTTTGRGYRILPYGSTEDGRPVLFFKSRLSPDGCDAHFAACLIRVA